MNEDISGAPQFSLSSSASSQFGRSSFLQPLELLFSLDLVRPKRPKPRKKYTQTHTPMRDRNTTVFRNNSLQFALFYVSLDFCG